jgi:Holliday junction resolvase RusA-like endonuclease
VPGLPQSVQDDLKGGQTMPEMPVQESQASRFNRGMRMNEPKIVKLVEFTIPGKCIGYNKHFKINYRTRQIYLTQAAHDWKRKVHVETPKIESGEDDLIQLEIEVYQNWFFKNGKIKKEDIHNMDKILIDSMCGKWGIDDSRVQLMSIQKIQSDEEFVRVRVFTCPCIPEKR